MNQITGYNSVFATMAGDVGKSTVMLFIKYPPDQIHLAYPFDLGEFY
ncbi:MAG: hypothetical protein RLZZ414_1967 [Bacteroidota bacterium]|jgi:hypothetical protein